MIEIAVTDAHALIWYAQSERRKLGSVARRIFDSADDNTAVVYVPAVALAEIGESVQKGKIRLERPFSEWARALLASRHFVPVDLTWQIILRAEELYAIPERGDRLIAATAAHLGFPLITRDPEIARAAGVEVVW
jgi:PIN domain nuclease of toxin-antitoxin system